MNEVLFGLAKALVESGVNIIYIPEPTASSTMISPRMFSQFVLPRLQSLTSRLKVPAILHICGDTGPILPAMAQSGAKGLSLDQCMDLSNARAVVPGMVLAGNVDPVKTLLMGDTEAVKERCVSLSSLCRGRSLHPHARMRRSAQNPCGESQGHGQGRGRFWFGIMNRFTR